MIRTVLDWRVAGPVLVAAVIFAVHETRRAPQPARVEPPAHVLTLPDPLAWAGPPRGTSYELDADAATVRFHVETGGETVDAVCPASHGRLVFAERGRPESLELVFELAALRGVDGRALGDELSRLLGIRRGESIVYRARLLAHETYATAGVARCTFVGALGFGPRRRQQPMQLWLALLVPGTVQLQGVGTVAGHDFGLPLRHWLGLLPEPSRITLALDLPFRRESG